MYHKDIKDWKTLEGILNVEPLVFPEKGIERYESLKNSYDQAKKDINLRLEKLKVLKHEIGQVELPDEKNIEYLEGLKTREPEIKQKNLEIDRLKRSMKNLKDKITRLQKKNACQQE